MRQDAVFQGALGRAATLFAAALLFLSPPAAEAGPRTGVSPLRDLSADAPKALRFTFRRPETGRVEVRLTGKRLEQAAVRFESSSGARIAPHRTVLYRADVRARKLHGPGATRGSAAWYRSARTGTGVLHLPLSLTSVKRSSPVRRDYELLLFSSGRAPVVRRAPPLWPARDAAFYCAAASTIPGTEDAPVAARAGPRALASRFLSVSIEIDSHFYALYGADTPSVVILALQGVQDIYNPQLDIDLRTVALTIYSDPAGDPYRSQTFNFSTLLDRVQARANGAAASNSDLHHLFTAHRGFTQAIGLAYVGTVCRFPDFDMGWSDYGSGFLRFVQTVAHEFGHSLGANHDFSSTDSIMSGTGAARATDPYFSPMSVAEISAFASQFGSCLGAEQGQPIGTPATNPEVPDPNETRSNIRISIARALSGRRGVVSGTIRSILNGALRGRVVELRRARDLRLLKTTRTNSRGRYKFQVAPRGSFFVVERMSQKGSGKVRF